MDTVKVYMFKAQEGTNRFNKNQKVWVRINQANYLMIRHKFRGSGRYVNGKIDKNHNAVGELKEIEIDKDFVDRHNLLHVSKHGSEGVSYKL